MGSRGTRSVFAAALCTGVAMVGLSVHGLLGIDSELAQTAVAVRQQQPVEYHSVHVLHYGGDCDRAPASKPDQRI
jgi:hypothetical protein